MIEKHNVISIADLENQFRNDRRHLGLKYGGEILKHFTDVIHADFKSWVELDRLNEGGRPADIYRRYIIRRLAQRAPFIIGKRATTTHGGAFAKLCIAVLPACGFRSKGIEKAIEAVLGKMSGEKQKGWKAGEAQGEAQMTNASSIPGTAAQIDDLFGSALAIATVIQMAWPNRLRCRNLCPLAPEVRSCPGPAVCSTLELQAPWTVSAHRGSCICAGKRSVRAAWPSGIVNSTPSSAFSARPWVSFWLAPMVLIRGRIARRHRRRALHRPSRAQHRWLTEAGIAMAFRSAPQNDSIAPKRWRSICASVRVVRLPAMSLFPPSAI